MYKNEIITHRKYIEDIEKQQAEDAKNSKAPDFKLESQKSKLLGLIKKNLYLLDMIGNPEIEVDTENEM